jgi:hypothetical protein
MKSPPGPTPVAPRSPEEADAFLESFTGRLEATGGLGDHTEVVTTLSGQRRLDAAYRLSAPRRSWSYLAVQVAR